MTGPRVSLENIPSTDNNGKPPSPLRRRLAESFPGLREEVEPGEAGGVPLPTDWHCVRATVGGASRKELETAYGADQTDESREAADMVKRAELHGSHLSAGLHIVTGQTGGGKSALVTNLALGAAEAGYPVLYVSLELDGREVAARVVGLKSGLTWSTLARSRPLTEEDRARRDNAMAELRDVAERLETWVPEGGIDLPLLRRDVLDLWREHQRTPLVLVDYLQLAGVRGSEQYQAPLRERLHAVTVELRRLSRESPTEDGWRGCPVVVLSSTARANVKGEGALPGLDGKSPDRLRHADLEALKALPKEAGDIEAAAVTAWVVAIGEEVRRGVYPFTLRQAKHRFGSAGQWIPFQFYGASGRLVEEPDRYATAAEAEREEREREQENGQRGGRRKSPAVSGPTAAEAY